MEMFSKMETAELVCLGAVAAITAWVLFRTYRQIRRHKKNRSPAVRVERSHARQRGHGLDAPPEVLRWEVQMHETARDLSAQLDSKMSALQALINEADRAAARLENALNPTGDVGRDSDNENLEPTQPQPTDQAAALKSPSESGGGISDRSSTRPDRAQVYTLADYGYDAAEIAARVGSPVGEIELVLGLRKER